MLGARGPWVMLEHNIIWYELEESALQMKCMITGFNYFVGHFWQIWDPKELLQQRQFFFVFLFFIIEA